MLKNYVKLIVAILFVSNVMTQNIPSYVPKDGLVGYWPFNGNANDESGNGNHGTVNGATLTTDRNGISNNAYNFDGVDDFISTKLINSSIDITISIWVKVKTDRFSYPLGLGFNKISGHGYGLGYSSINGECQLIKKSFFVFDGKNTCQNRIETEPINELNKWENLTFIIKSNSIKIFKNNIYQKELNIFEYKGINLLTFGVRSDNVFYFGGQLDDIAIYNRALSDQEVKQLYEGCTKETATSSSFNSVVYTTNTSVNLSANPTGGTFNGEAVANNSFNPSKAKLGKNQVKYNFKNSTGCADSTNFTMILVDTLGNKCTETIYDTIKVKESTYDTLKIKVKLTTGIKAGQLTSMNVYPNPASDVLIIEANDIQALSGYKYKIVDLQGKEVYNALATAAKTEISLNSIGAKGMYILHIVDEKGVSIENKKIVLE
jgi:hypothetical protein